MNQPSRWGIARLVRVAATFGAVVLFAAGRLAAQGTTGKIEGTVKDQSGAPIAGAQVLIVGSAFSSSTNEQGYYFINSVTAGVMTVRAQFIGYAPSETRNVRVFAGQTMTVNLTLEQRAIEVTGINVTTQQNAIVPRDQVTSKPIVQGELIQALPVDNVQQVLRLQPGVVESDRGISIRGSRVGEAAVYVDGVPVRSVSGNTGASGSGMSLGNTVGTNSLEEVSVTTGAIGATQGDAQSGVISFVTRSGGQRFSGNLSLATDEVSGQKFGAGVNRLEASIGGPLMRNLTFFVSTTLEGQQSPRRGLGADKEPIYVQNGFDSTITIPLEPGVATSDSAVVELPRFARYSTGQRRPDNWSNNWNADAKLQYTYGSGSRLAATFHRARTQGLNYRGNNVLNAQAQTGFLATTNVLTLNWSQNLAHTSERQLLLDANFSLQSDRTVGGPVDQGWLATHHSPTGNFNFGNIPFIYDLNTFPLDDRLLQNIRVNNCTQGRDALRRQIGGCIPLLNRNDLGRSATYRFNPYGLPSGTSYMTNSGIGSPNINLNTESRITGRVSLNWQADRYNLFQFGGDFVRANSKNYSAGLVSQGFMDANYYKPYRFGMYAQDRLDLGDVVIDLGLRYDRMKSGVLYPNTPGNVYSDPLRSGNAGLAILTSRNITPTAGDIATAQKCQNALDATVPGQTTGPGDTLALSTCNMFEGASRGVLLPSLRVSFPVTDRTGFRLSYAQQAQTPDFNLLATGANTDILVTNTNDVFGRDLDYGKTILFEFGVRHAFNADMVLDIAAYNKDLVSEFTARVLPVFLPSRGEFQATNLMTNADFGNVRGVDVKLDRRVGQLFQGSLAYTFESSRSTGSDPFEYLNTLSRQISNVTNERVAPPQALLRTRDNRTHTIAGSMALNFPHGWRAGTTAGAIFQDFGAFATFRFASGLAYTRLANVGGGVTGPGNGFGNVGTGLEELNASQMPWIKNVDLRLTRGFRMGGTRDLTVFADFRNLFNWTNLVAIFAETGDVVNKEFERVQTSPLRVNLQGEAGTLFKTVNPVSGATETGVDLRDCTLYAPTAAGGVGRPNCIMLQGAEARFGNGDQYFTIAEQNLAYGAFYRLNNGPYSLKGPGFNFRLGFELNF